MASRFLYKLDLWNELDELVPDAKRVHAAVAYFGSGGSNLLPLRPGDRLVVDMSLPTVRAGMTDPREVKKLLNNGVEVFSRTHLHAKFLLIDRVVIAGSSNVSRRARDVLDEAAVLTDDTAAVRRAAAVFDSLCTEPVRAAYLKKCLEQYRPPKFPEGGARSGGRRRHTPAKLWIVGGLVYSGIPEAEQERADDIAGRAARRLRDYEQCEVSYSNYAKRLRLFGELREDDWVVKCIKDGAGYDVWPPSRFLGVESYARGHGKRRYLLLVEQPMGAKPVRWRTLRARAAADVPGLDRAAPRTMPIQDGEQADAVLRLWNTRGDFRARTRP